MANKDKFEMELEEIKKLPPKQRLIRLESLKKKRAEEKKKQEIATKKEVEESNRIIAQSMKEMELERMLQEIEVPKKDLINVDKIIAETDFDEELKKGEFELKGQQQYNERMKKLLSPATQEAINDWYKQDSPPPSQQEFLDMYNKARSAYDVARQEIEKRPNMDSYLTQSEKMVEKTVGSIRMLRALGYKHDLFPH